jgi:hypothetical protein
MGESRMRYMEERLPPGATILGIDEYTACIVDLGQGSCHVMGVGEVTIRRHGQELGVYPAESSFPVNLLQAPTDVSSTASSSSLQLTDLIEWPEAQQSVHVSDVIAPYVDLIVDIRALLRERRQWELADLIRDRLSELGIAVEDGVDGSSWREI